MSPTQQNKIREARSLAQKLYGRCRDSSSGYKVLAAPIRKLRNILEELEEVSIEKKTQWSDDPRFTVQLNACSSLLEELDLTLQSHRCSTHRWQDVLQQSTIRLSKDISLVTNDLSLSLEAIINPPAPSHLTIDTQVSAAFDENCSLTRKFSWEDGGTKEDERKHSVVRFEQGLIENLRAATMQAAVHSPITPLRTRAASRLSGARPVQSRPATPVAQSEQAHNAHGLASVHSTPSAKSAAEELLEETEELSQSIIDAMLEEEAATKADPGLDRSGDSTLPANQAIAQQNVISEKVPVEPSIVTVPVGAGPQMSSASRPPSIAEAPTTPAFVIVRDSLASAAQSPLSLTLDDSQLPTVGETAKETMPMPNLLKDELGESGDGTNAVGVADASSEAIILTKPNALNNYISESNITGETLQNNTADATVVEQARTQAEHHDIDSPASDHFSSSSAITHASPAKGLQTPTSALSPKDAAQNTSNDILAMSLTNATTNHAVEDDSVSKEPAVVEITSVSSTSDVLPPSKAEQPVATIVDAETAEIAPSAAVNAFMTKDGTEDSSAGRKERPTKPTTTESERRAALPTLSISSPVPHHRSASRDFCTSANSTTMFQSPFTIFDPLSMDIESASQLLLGEPDSAQQNHPSTLSNQTSTPASAVDSGVETSPEDRTKHYKDQTELFEASNDPDSAEDLQTTGLGISIAAVEEAVKPESDPGEAQAVVSQAIDIGGNTIELQKALSTPPTESRLETINEEVMPIQDSVTSMTRNDSGHAKPQRLPSLTIPGSLQSTVEATIALADLAEEGDDLTPANDRPLVDGVSPTAFLRAKWQSLRPPSSQVVQRSSTQAVPKPKSFLQDQIRRVSFRTRRAGESVRFTPTEFGHSPTSPMTPIVIEEHIGMVRDSPRSGKIVPHIDGLISAALTSPGISPKTLEKDLPALPPLEPVRPPSNVPTIDTSEVESPVRVYRVVNPSPSILSGASEDLYSSSQPTSPVKHSPTQASSVEPVAIVEIKIQEATLEQGCESHEQLAQLVAESQAKGSANLMTNVQTDNSGDISQSGTDVAPPNLHSSLANPDLDRTLSLRKSADNISRERYFTIELEESSTGTTPRRQSLSALATPQATIHDDPSRPVSAESSVSGGPPTSYYSAALETAKVAIQPEKSQIVYGSSRDGLDYSRIDTERLKRLCRCWNQQQWENAESYLVGHLESMLDQGRYEAVRRVKHLQGVCASLRGQWQRALTCFVAVLHTDVTNISQLDFGDFAAYYWLGDTYALLNRRTEALLAYSMAAQINTYLQGPVSQAMLLNEEQGALLLFSTPQELLACWQRMMSGSEKATDSILNRSILDANLIAKSLEAAARCTARENPTLKSRNRAGILCELEGCRVIEFHHCDFELTKQSFEENQGWPLLYDPFFVARNVATGRLCDQRSNLLTALCKDAMYKVPKHGLIGAARLDCFTCNHLDWLIVAVRQCLVFLDMRWDEVANEYGCWFLVRFAVKSRNVIAANYFAISLFKQSMRPGYGVEVCVDGVKSSRILAHSPDYVNGVHNTCDRRLRKLVKDYLSHAYKLWLKGGKTPIDARTPIAVKRTTSQMQRMPASLQVQADNIIVPSRTPALSRRPDIGTYG